MPLLCPQVDGVDALNNILLIGMTNRKDMLDEAMLRPGRLEVQIEIGLPDEKGRLQILKIHTSKVRLRARGALLVAMDEVPCCNWTCIWNAFVASCDETHGWIYLAVFCKALIFGIFVCAGPLLQCTRGKPALPSAGHRINTIWHPPPPADVRQLVPGARRGPFPAGGGHQELQRRRD